MGRHVLLFHPSSQIRFLLSLRSSSNDPIQRKERHMKVSRRGVMATSLAATQLALLSRFNMLRDVARADAPTDRPTKLLTIFVPGGLHHELIWSVFYDEVISRYVPRPQERMFYDA